MNDGNQPLSQPTVDIEKIIKQLVTLNPLDDRAFKKLLSDVEQFKNLAEAFTGKTLDEANIIAIKDEIFLSVKGRLIHLDSLHSTDVAYVNMEGQMKAADFPFKRHVFHGAATYVSELEKSDDWQILKPAISIVVYKDKGDAELMEDASFSGKLVKTEDDRNQLLLIAVNSKKWKDAQSEELRAYLSTLHNGIMTEDNKADFADVDTSSLAFINFQRAVRIACAKTWKQEYEERKDDFMATQYETYLSREEREIAMEEGMDIAQKIIRMLKDNIPVAEIAKDCNVPTQRVENLRMAVS